MNVARVIANSYSRTPCREVPACRLRSLRPMYVMRIRLLKRTSLDVVWGDGGDQTVLISMTNKGSLSAGGSILNGICNSLNHNWHGGET